MEKRRKLGPKVDFKKKFQGFHNANGLGNTELHTDIWKLIVQYKYLKQLNCKC